ncbi:glycosyltransferase [Naasia sp. SYSU D00948]|uniref:glycosyltransferase n=1 Tax=Naasia sp. SYSU D00948 TaxID=2817379 RepID=UPI001B31198F|nr:glycosyltransferase [Naasia sp. SYSU D00948]
MAERPPFSLLLPVYRGDRADFLRAAIRTSVDEQTLPPDEVVVVEDGPISPELRAEIEAFVERATVPVVHLPLPVNRGLAHALTAGLEACSHEVVARMDADDLSTPERFAVQLQRIGEGYELVGTGMLEFSEGPDGSPVLGALRLPPAGQEEISRFARFHDPFNHPTVVYTKAAVARAGGYLPMGKMEDYWLFARMLSVGVRAANVPLPLLHYRVSSGAYSRRGGRELLASELALQRAFLSIGFVSPMQFARNVGIRGAYRLIPEAARRQLYRRYVMRSA